jgi:hypothetical protein
VITEVSRRVLRYARYSALGERVVALVNRELVAERDRLAAERDQLVQAAIHRQAELELLERTWDHYRDLLPPPTFEDLTEDLRDDSLPPLDRPHVDVSALSEDQRHWFDHGYLIKKGFVPADLLDAYWAARTKLKTPVGWLSGSPYMHVPEVLDLSVYRPLVDLLHELIGEQMGVHLNLTGTISSERNWHQDDYLNAPLTKGWYAAVWFAVGDVDPESGPFQFVPGSHRWPVLRREKVRLFLTPEERRDRGWAKFTERFLDDILEAEIINRRASVETFIGQKGDILVWHARLLHRGSPPKIPGRLRMGFISHYVGLSHWATGPRVGRHRDGGLYFLSDEPLY